MGADLMGAGWGHLKQFTMSLKPLPNSLVFPVPYKQLKILQIAHKASWGVKALGATQH